MPGTCSSLNEKMYVRGLHIFLSNGRRSEFVRMVAKHIFNVCPEYLANAPGLSNAASGLMGRITIEYLGYGSKTRLLQVRHDPLNCAAGLRSSLLSAHLHKSSRIRA
jgi:hypothetical protein